MSLLVLVLVLLVDLLLYVEPDVELEPAVVFGRACSGPHRNYVFLLNDAVAIHVQQSLGQSKCSTALRWEKAEGATRGGPHERMNRG